MSDEITKTTPAAELASMAAVVTDRLAAAETCLQALIASDLVRIEDPSPQDVLCIRKLAYTVRSSADNLHAKARKLEAFCGRR